MMYSRVVRRAMEANNDKGFAKNQTDYSENTVLPRHHPAGQKGAAMNDQQVEQEIKDKGLTAPRVTHQRIEEVVVSEDYHVFPGTTLTVCCLTLANGYAVTGESACASPENFDEELGRRIARTNARNKIWDLEGYALRERLALVKANPA